MLHAEELRWDPEPVPALDLTSLSDEELIAHAVSEAGAYRQLAQAAIHALYTLNHHFERVRAQHHRALDELRHVRLRGAA